MEVEVRGATEADVAEVAAIHEHEVRHGHATFDVEPPPRAQWTARLSSDHPGDHFLVAQVNGRVHGYAYSGSYRGRAAYHHTREVAVHVDRDSVGFGIGRRLYGDLIARMTRAGVHTALAVVALPDEASEALHRACGFERVGVMREVGHKFDGWIDVAWWQKLLDHP